MMALERIPNQVGFLVLTEDGAVICSGGDLENSEHIANVVLGLITLTDSIGNSDEGFKKISVIYQEFCYIICLSNKKIYIIKTRYNAPKPPSLISDLSSVLHTTTPTTTTISNTASTPNLQPSASTSNTNISSATVANSPNGATIDSSPPLVYI